MDDSLDAAASAFMQFEQPQEQQVEVNEENTAEEEISDDADKEGQEELLDAEEDQEEQEVDSEGKIKFEYNGEVIEVDQTELIKGYKRQSDLTRSFQETAEIRKQAEANAQHFQQKFAVLDQYQERLDILDQVLETPPVDLNTLNQLLDDGDTEQYLRLKNELDQWQNKKAAVQGQKAELNRFRAEAQLRGMQEQQVKERELLYKSYPDLANKENAAKLNSYLLGMGYTEQDLRTVIDHRNFIIADKARRFDELQSKAATTKQPSSIPKVLKKGATPIATDVKSDSYKKQFAQLRKSGSLEDATALFLSKINK